MHLVVLLCGEVLLALDASVQRACNVIARVSDALQLAYLAQHGAYLGLGVVGEVGIADLVEVLGNLYLHVVGDALVLLYARECLYELGLVLLVYQVAHQVEHPLYAHAKLVYLLLCLQHGEFRGLHDAGGDEAQAEVLLLALGFLGLDDAAHELLYLRNEPDEDGGVGHVEAGVEGSEHERQLGGVLEEARLAFHYGVVVAHERAYHVDEGTEHQQYPHHSEDVEEHMGEGSAARLRVGCHGSEVRGYGGAYVLAHDEGYALIDGEHAAGAEYHGDGHDGSRRLHAEREQSSEQQEADGREEAVWVERAEEVEHGLVVSEVHVNARLAQRAQSEEHERYSEEEVAYVSLLLTVDKYDCNEERRVDKIGDVERESRRHDPCGEGRSDVCSHDY